MVVEVAERATVVAHVDPLGPVKGDGGAEAFAKQLEADDEIGAQRIALSLPDARGRAPRQKLGVAFDVGHEVEELLLRVRQEPLFRVGRHEI